MCKLDLAEAGTELNAGGTAMHYEGTAAAPQ